MKGREGNTKTPHTENIQLHCERDHLTNEGDEARLEEGGKHVLLNTCGGGGDYGLDNIGGVDIA